MTKTKLSPKQVLETLTAQRWRRHGDSCHANGHQLADRLSGGIWSTPRQGRDTLIATKVGDAIKTGFSAWERIA